MSEERKNRSRGSASKMLGILQRRRDYLEKRCNGGAVKGYDNEERLALAWVFNVLGQECSCEGDANDPCFHCATHGVIAARRLIDKMGCNQAAAIRYLQDRGEHASAEAVRDILHPTAAARAGGSA